MANNLLDKASIILTPTAYNNGKALCVKPSDGSGDFDFSRNSAATRVNAQGLVENVQILSSNLVQNGDFSEEGAEEVSNGSFSQEGAELITNGSFDTDSNWTKVNATISGGTGNLDSTSGTSLLFQSALVVGKTYKAILDVTNYNGLGTCALINSNGDIQFEITSNGNKEFYFTQGGSSSNLSFRAINGGIFSIDNCSVREVGQDWVLGTGWSIGEDKAVFIGSSSGEYLVQNNVYTLNSSIKLTFDVLDYVSGSVRIIGGGSVWGSGAVSSNGTHTFYIDTSGAVNNNIYVQAISGVFNGSITNISVKEVGMDWTLNDWSVGDSLISSGNTSSLLEQFNIYTSTTSIYKTTFKAKSVSGASVTLRVYDGGGNTYETFTITSSDFQDFELTRQRQGSNPILYFYNNSNAEIEITNISVIEITDDTNLPRINYEGFSYQDALGSELVVNGDFDTDSDWVKGTGWTISGGTANAAIPVASGLTASVGALTIGTTYKLTYTISNYSAGNIVIQAGWQASGASRSANGTYTEYLVCAGDTYVAFLGTSSFIGSIDNVSVKEYLGQEVVPDSGCGSWLFEPQSTNLVTDSQNYNSTYWGGQRGTLSDGGVGLFYLSPTSNVIKYEVTTTGFNQLYYRLPSAVTIGNTYTQQGYVKCDDAPYIIFQISTLTGNPFIVWDNINNVVISSDPSIDSFDITSLNGWVKAEITYTATVASIYASLKTYFSTTTSNTQGVPIGTIAYQTFVQVEQQSYATSYIPTSGSTVTRNQDVCNNGGSLATINSTEGVLYAEIAINQNDNGGFRLISMTDASDSVRIGFGKKDNEAKWYIKILIGALNITSQAIDFQEGFQKIAIRYKSGDSGVYINGTKVITDTSNYVNTLIIDNVSFDFTGNAFPFFGKTKALAVWKEALSDSELQSLTTI